MNLDFCRFTSIPFIFRVIIQLLSTFCRKRICCRTTCLFIIIQEHRVSVQTQLHNDVLLTAEQRLKWWFENGNICIYKTTKNQFGMYNVKTGFPSGC